VTRSFFGGEIKLMENIPPPPKEFRERMTALIRETEIYCLEEMPIPEYRQWESIVDEDSKQEGFVCKTEGCSEPVNSNKGLAAYCTKLQPSGDTHRKGHIDEMRKLDPSYLTRTNGKNQKGGKRAEVVGAPTAQKIFPVADKQASAFWLDEVDGMIQEAIQRVKVAQDDLQSAKAGLKEILTQALGKVE
jgi:hypothetical protein